MVAEALVQALVVPPGDPLQGRRFQRLHALERRGASDQFCFAGAVGALGQGEGVGIFHRAGGREDPGLAQMRAVQAVDALGAVIRVADQSPGVAVSGRPADRLIQGDQGKRTRVPAGRDRPSEDPAGVRVGDERHVGETPGCQARRWLCRPRAAGPERRP